MAPTEKPNFQGFDANSGLPGETPTSSPTPNQAATAPSGSIVRAHSTTAAPSSMPANCMLFSTIRDVLVAWSTAENWVSTAPATTVTTPDSRNPVAPA